MCFVDSDGFDDGRVALDVECSLLSFEWTSVMDLRVYFFEILARISSDKFSRGVSSEE